MPVPKRVTSWPGSDDHSLSPFEAVLRTEEIGQGQAGDAKIDRAFAFQRGSHNSAQVGVVTRIGHRMFGSVRIIARSSMQLWEAPARLVGSPT